MVDIMQPVTRDGNIVGWMFWCPGCEGYHVYYTDPDWRELCWKFNGDRESPTFTPSLLMRDDKGTTCHLFVIDGQIRYCGDCRHHLSGKTVPLLPMPDDD